MKSVVAISLLFPLILLSSEANEGAIGTAENRSSRPLNSSSQLRARSSLRLFGGCPSCRLFFSEMHKIQQDGSCDSRCFLFEGFRSRSGWECGACEDDGDGEDRGNSGPGTDPGTDTSPGTTADCGNTYEQEVVGMTNKERSQNLNCNSVANQVARDYSQLMCDQLCGLSCTHNQDGRNAGQRLDSAGVNWLGWGENIAFGYGTPEQVMDGWMNSPPHRDNIQNSNFNEIGVGYIDCQGDGISYWTMVLLKE